MTLSTEKGALQPVVLFGHCFTLPLDIVRREEAGFKGRARSVSSHFPKVTIGIKLR